MEPDKEKLIGKLLENEDLASAVGDTAFALSEEFSRKWGKVVFEVPGTVINFPDLHKTYSYLYPFLFPAFPDSPTVESLQPIVGMLAEPFVDYITLTNKIIVTNLIKLLTTIEAISPGLNEQGEEIYVIADNLEEIGEKYGVPDVEGAVARALIWHGRFK